MFSILEEVLFSPHFLISMFGVLYFGFSWVVGFLDFFVVVDYFYIYLVFSEIIFLEWEYLFSD